MASEYGDSQLEIGALESEASEEHRSIPCQCLSDMFPDFKRVLKNVAEDITDLSTLSFMCDMNLTDTKLEKSTALAILWKQVQKGKFAHDNIEPLERLLTDIDRCDLASKHIEPYKQKYGEHTTSKGLSSRKITSPARSIQRTPSAHSLPATSLSLHSNASQSNFADCESTTGARNERKAKTDPSSQRTRAKEMSQAKIQQKYTTTGVRPLVRQRCSTVPEEESSAASLQLPTSSLRPNMQMVPSFQPQSRDRVRDSQDWSDSQSEVSLSQSRSQTPSTVHATAEHYSLGNAAASAARTPTRPGRSLSNVRPHSSLSIGDDNYWRSRNGSATPRGRESVSTPASEQWSANLDDPDVVEEPSFSFSELEENREYNSPSLPPRNVHNRCSVCTAASGLSHPCLHNHNYPHHSEASLSACSNPFPTCQHHPGSAQYPAVHSSCCSLPAMMQQPLYPAAPHVHSAFQCPGQPSHTHNMTTPGSCYQHRKQGVYRSGSSTQPPKTHTTKCTWAVTRKCLMKGMQQHGRPLKSRVNFTLPVGCKKRRDPKIYLSMIPCESRDSRHVVIEGELLIPRNCSRHKWLVEYCDCSVRLSVEVVNPKNNITLGNASGEFGIAHSEIDCDHRTHMKLDKVLKHEVFLYGNACVDKFRFHATVQLFELECRLDNTVQYECKESEFDFTEISLLSVPSQVTSSSQ